MKTKAQIISNASVTIEQCIRSYAPYSTAQCLAGIEHSHEKVRKQLVLLTDTIQRYLDVTKD